MPRWLPALVLPLALTALTVAVPPDAEKEKGKKAAPPTDADQAAARAQVEGGLRAEVWAAEPLLANPVAFAFDERGGCYVAESTRFGNGVPDTRNHMYWLDEDLACRTVADRLAMYKKHKYEGYEKFPDQLRKVWSKAGAGRADTSTVFSGGYNRPEDGLAAGVLARKGDVLFACIPDLLRLRDKDGDGVADDKASLSTGYGVRAQFIGHDLHGLRMGPDGKLYFTVGDRGMTVVTKEGRTLSNPDSGCVLRCDPDGANLEIVHTGLRNPQELAFDDFGNLFTYDNNSDSGDQARWVQVVEGGDSGWRCGYQYGTLMHHAGVPQGNRGPWNAEKMWHVPGPDGGPPAYVVPPLAHLGNGPSGITHYPGVGLGDRYKDHFFAADFTASPGNSVIWSLAVKPKGASFEVVDRHPFVRNMVPTDCEFGPDGAFYWTDWVGGWSPPNKGRIFRVADPEALKNPAVAEARTLLAEGLEKKSVEELAKLLGHPHQTVRLEAQYELTKVVGHRRKAFWGGRDAKVVIPALQKVAADPANRLARLHAIWGLGTIAGDHSSAMKAVAELCADPDADVRAQAAKTLGEVAEYIGRNYGGIPSWRRHLADVEKLLEDSEPRVRAAAVTAYARFGPMPLWINPGSEPAYFSPLFEVLKSNADQDPYLRHAAVVALARSVGDSRGLVNVWKRAGHKYDTPAVRLGLVLALRRLRAPQLAEFLADADPRVVAEAARAVHDENVAEAMAALAALVDKPGLPDPVAYRALSANYKLGGPDHAARVANFAARAAEPAHLRQAALTLLGDWPKPPRRDPITGLAIALPERPVEVAAAAVRTVLPKLFAGPDAVRRAAVGMTSKLALQDVGPIMAGLVADAGQPAGVRVEALFALEAVKATELAASANAALASPEPRLRAAARVVAAKADPAAAARELPALLNDDRATAVEKQMALGVLGGLKESKEADAALAGWLDRYAAGRVPAELKLDVLEAAQARAEAKKLPLHAPLREKLQAIDQAARAAVDKDPLARHREALAGGDPDKGRDAFLNNAAVYCQRCHKVGGQGGEVGPALDGVGARHPRDYLLEAIVHPNAKIAEGYQSVILNTVDGRSVTGVLRAKDAGGYTVVTADNKVVTVPKDDVEAERPDKSAMPDDLHKKLSKRELRDLVEFLASLRDAGKR